MLLLVGMAIGIARIAGPRVGAGRGDYNRITLVACSTSKIDARSYHARKDLFVPCRRLRTVTSRAKMYIQKPPYIGAKVEI